MKLKYLQNHIISEIEKSKSQSVTKEDVLKMMKSNTYYSHLSSVLDSVLTQMIKENKIIKIKTDVFGICKAEEKEVAEQESQTSLF